MNTTKHINIVDLPSWNNGPRVLLPLPLPTQPILSAKIALQQTGLPERHLRVSLGNRTQSQYFLERSLQYPFRRIQLVPCLFPGIILRTQILKILGSPSIVIVVIKFRAIRLIVTNSFSSPLLATNNQAKLDAGDTACAYILGNLMTDLQQLNNVAGQWNNKLEGNQSEDKDPILQTTSQIQMGLMKLSRENHWQSMMVCSTWMKKYQKITFQVQTKRI